MSGYQNPYAPGYEPGNSTTAVRDVPLAQGVKTVGGFTAFELWAGESDIVTTQGIAGADLVQFQVVSVDDRGYFIPWTGTGGTNAVGNFVFNTIPNDGDYVTINGVQITFVYREANEGEIDFRGMTLPQLATTFAAYVTANQRIFNVTAVSEWSTNQTVALIAAQPTAGFGFTLPLGNNGNVYAYDPDLETTVGQDVTSTVKPFGFTAQAATSGGPVPVFVGGTPNHEILVWPDSCSSIEERQQAFFGSNITIGVIV